MKSTIDDIKSRRSHRKFDARQISDSELDTILEAGTYAATGAGSQSPVMVVSKDQATIDKMEKLNAAAMGKPEAHTFYGANLVVTVFADMTKPTPIQDASLVMGNLMLAAHAIGVGSCWINRAKEVFETPEGKELKKAWGVGDNFQGVAHCILGYAADEPKAAPRKEGWIIR
jgi:nitroreductase